MWKHQLENCILRNLRSGSYGRLLRQGRNFSYETSPNIHEVRKFTSRFVGAWESVMVPDLDNKMKKVISEEEEEFERFLSQINILHQSPKVADSDFKEINFDTFPFLYSKFPDMDRFKMHISVGEIMEQMTLRPLERTLVAVTGEDCTEIVSTDEADLQKVHEELRDSLVFVKSVPANLNAEDLIRCMNNIGPVRAVKIFRSSVVDGMQVNTKKLRVEQKKFIKSTKNHAAKEKAKYYERLAGQYHGQCLAFTGLHNHPQLLSQIKTWVKETIDAHAKLEISKDGRVVLDTMEILDETVFLKELSDKIKVKLSDDNWEVNATNIVVPDYANTWTNSRKRPELARLQSRLKRIDIWLKSLAKDEKQTCSCAWSYEEVDGNKKEKDLIITGNIFLGGVIKKLQEIIAPYPDVSLEGRSSHFVGKLQHNEQKLAKYRYKPNQSIMQYSLPPPPTKVSGVACVWFDSPETCKKALDPQLRVTGIQIKGRTMRLTDYPKTVSLTRLPWSVVSEYKFAGRQFAYYEDQVDDDFVREDIHVPYPLRRKPNAPTLELPAHLQEVFPGLQKIYMTWHVNAMQRKVTNDLILSEYAVGEVPEPDKGGQATYLAYFLAVGQKQQNIAAVNISLKNIMVLAPHSYNDAHIKVDKTWQPQLYEEMEYGQWIPLVSVTTDEEEVDLKHTTAPCFSRDSSTLSRKSNQYDFAKQNRILGAVAVHSYRPAEVILTVNSAALQEKQKELELQKDTMSAEQISEMELEIERLKDMTKIWINEEPYKDSATLHPGFNQFLFEFTDGTIPSITISNALTGMSQHGIRWRYDIPPPTFIFEYDSADTAMTSMHKIRQTIDNSPKLFKIAQTHIFENKDPIELILQFNVTPKIESDSFEEIESSERFDVGAQAKSRNDEWNFLFNDEEDEWIHEENEAGEKSPIENLLEIMQDVNLQEIEKPDFRKKKLESFDYMTLLGRHKIVRQSSLLIQAESESGRLG